MRHLDAMKIVAVNQCPCAKDVDLMSPNRSDVVKRQREVEKKKC